MSNDKYESNEIQRPPEETKPGILRTVIVHLRFWTLVARQLWQQRQKNASNSAKTAPKPTRIHEAFDKSQ